MRAGLYLAPSRESPGIWIWDEHLRCKKNVAHVFFSVWSPLNTVEPTLPCYVYHRSLPWKSIGHPTCELLFLWFGELLWVFDLVPRFASIAENRGHELLLSEPRSWNWCSRVGVTCKLRVSHCWTKETTVFCCVGRPWMWKSIHVATTCKSEGLHNWDLCEEGCCPRTVVSLLAVVTKGEIVAWEEEDLISNLCS